MRVRSEIATSSIFTQYPDTHVSVKVIVNDSLRLMYSEPLIFNVNEMKVHRDSFFQW